MAPELPKAITPLTAEEIKSAWLEVFPNSHAYVGKGCLTESLYITGYLQKPSEWANGISHNDPLSYSGWFEGNDFREDSLSLLQVPPSGSHLAYGSVKKRKTTIKNVDWASLVKRFKAIRAWIAENAGNVPTQFNIGSKGF